MNLVFSDEPLPSSQTHSIFLSGPSPRRADVPDDRVALVAELTRQGFTGTVFIPIPRGRFNPSASSDFSNDASWSYDHQIAWECAARQRADVIVFWVPRCIDASAPDLGMPAFTTNVEFGEDLHSGKMVYGRPDNAVKMRYLDERARSQGWEIHTTMASLCRAAGARLKSPALRHGGEQDVPLFIWHTAAFQSWYRALKQAGNRLDGAQLIAYVPTPSGTVFSFVLKVNVWVEKEGRNKTNEVIHARSDTVQVAAFYQDHVVLVQEFRSPVNNATGMVWELPGGSSWSDTPAPQLAQQELEEETGLRITSLARFVRVEERQLAATFATHRATVFAVRLTRTEFEQLRRAASSGAIFGESKDLPSGERCVLSLVPLAKLANYPVDFSTLGMVHTAYAKLAE